MPLMLGVVVGELGRVLQVEFVLEARAAARLDREPQLLVGVAVREAGDPRRAPLGQLDRGGWARVGAEQLRRGSEEA